MFLIHQSLSHPIRVLLVGLIAVVLGAFGLTTLVKETSTDAFIPPGHASLALRDQVRDTFGLQDPLIVSVTTNQAKTLNPAALNTVLKLHEELTSLDNVSQVRSLVSEVAISADSTELYIEPLLVEPVGSTSLANNIVNQARSMPPFVGTLISKAGNATAIGVELVDQAQANATYEQIASLANAMASDDVHIHVAGQGAVGGYLSQYIDADSRKMQPVVVLTVLFLLFLAFRQLRALIGPLAIIAASAVTALGIMAWTDVPYYAITSALPVVIISIAVADTIHVLTAYNEIKTARVELSQPQAVELAMRDMMRPITLTSTTTVAGFAGLAFASIMPPVRYFGLFAALGVVLAWVFSMTMLPAILTLIKLPTSGVFRQQRRGNVVGLLLTKVAMLSLNHTKTFALVLVSVLLIAGYGASLVKVDRAQIENFRADEPIRIAHDHINDVYAGSSFLDFYVSTNEVDGLVNSSVLQAVDRFQTFLEAQDHVNKTQSILDTLAVLHGELTSSEHTRAFNDADSFSQYLLLYEASSEPQNYSNKIDNQYQHLLVRAFLNTDLYSEEKKLVETAQTYLNTVPLPEGMAIETTGRVHVDYHWMTQLAQSHFLGIGISLMLVGVFSALLFKSVYLGFVCVTPVFISILVVYAVMGYLGIFLEPATSMFAAIAIGVGVDFSIHLVERLQQAMKTATHVKTAVIAKFPNAARACFFNAAALASGFATLLLSELPTLQRFGAMITIACLASFFAALLIVPFAYQIHFKNRSGRVNQRSNQPLSV